MLKKILQQLTHTLPPHLAPSAALRALELLPREEFDAQMKVLTRLEAQLAQLEARLCLLEAQNCDTMRKG